MSLFINDNIIRNKYIIKNNICFILMDNINDFTIIDLEDLYAIGFYRIHCNNTGYAYFEYYDESGKHKILLSRFIMQIHGYDIDNMIVDHINHNILDNRKCNLRVCTKSENNFNGRTAKNNTSGVKGVYKGKSPGSWRACIWVNNQLHSLGTYKSFDEAVISRKIAEEKYFGQYNYNIENDVLMNNQTENSIIHPFKFII